MIAPEKNTERSEIFTYFSDVSVTQEEKLYD